MALTVQKKQPQVKPEIAHATGTAPVKAATTSVAPAATTAPATSTTAAPAKELHGKDRKQVGAEKFGERATTSAQKQQAAGGVGAQLKARDVFPGTKIGEREIHGERFEVYSATGADDVKTKKALNRYYTGYAKAFPDKNERMSKADIADCLGNDRYDALMLVKDGVVVGGVQCNFLKTDAGSFGVIEFRWVDADNRRQGLGKELYEMACDFFKSKDPKFLGTVGEFNDPRMMTKEELALDGKSMDPSARLAHHKSVGYRVFDAPYAQPPLVDDKGVPMDPVGYLMLAFNPRDKATTDVPASTYATLLKAYWGTFIDDIDHDKTANAILGSLAGMTSVKLVDVDAPRSCIDAQKAIREVIGG